MRKRRFAVVVSSLCLAAAAILTGCSRGTEIDGASGKEDSTQAVRTQPEADEGGLAWWQTTNAYEIYVNSFQDSDGDGYGDLNGIRSRLDHLKDLGVGAVWLTPVYASPMKDNGYDVADYYEINPRYGTMEDMEKLIAEAEEKGIRIVMDLVYNHTSDQNQWFLESSKSKDNDYSDWYIWRDAKEDGSEPNNWRSIFGGSAWTWCEARQQYYLHTFAAAQPDLNWANPDVRQALYDVANFWIDKGVGGFRMDAIPYIKKPADFADGPVDDSQGMSGIHNMTANTDGILDYLKEFKENVSAGKDIFTVAEANGVSADQLPSWVGKDGVFDMLFEFSHVYLEFTGTDTWARAEQWQLTDLKKALTASQEATADKGWYPIFFENHDQPRSINHYFPDDADPVLAGKAIGTVLLTLRGTPFIYQGQELGMTNVSWDSLDTYDDLNTKSQYEIALQEGFGKEEALEAVHRFSRDNARTPMQWDGTDNAGFTTGTPWLPVNENYKTVNLEAEQDDSGSVLTWYRTLTALRKDHPVLVEGSYEEKLADSEEIYAFIRENEEEKLLVLVNFTGHEVSYDPKDVGIGDGDEAEILLTSCGQDDKEGAGQVGTLRPYEALIIQ